ncbi:MAG: hypothetical protein RL021_2161 [Bacteroidota bacterium]
MEPTDIQLQDSDFRKLFPFHILLDREGRIMSIGDSLNKATSIETGSQFTDHFTVNRPFLIQVDFNTLSELCGSLFIIDTIRQPSMKLRGQWIKPEGKADLLFLGSPWFSSLQALKEQHLSINDFAPHDPVVDLLHILKTNEIGMEDVKEMLERYRKQQAELKRLSLIATESTNMVIVTGPQGEIEWVNRSFEENTGYRMHEVLGKKPGEIRSGPLTDQELERNLAESVRAGKPFNAEMQAYNKDGKIRWLRIHGQPVIDKSGRVEHYFSIEEDITEQKEALILLKLSEEKYRNILKNMDLGMVELDSEGKTVNCNECFQQLTGFTNEELAGKVLEDLLEFRSLNFEPAFMSRHRTRDVSELYEAELTDKSGETKWVLVSKSLQYDTRQMKTGSIGIYLDITWRKRMELELERARKVAEDSSKAKESFLINMSHEIRTPMNIIMGMSRHLSTFVEDPKQQGFLRSIVSAADNLLVVINDVLDIAKIEAGKLEIEQVGFSLRNTLEEVRQLLQFSAEEKNLQLTMEIDPEVQDILIGDPHRLNQILINLAGNALKFTESGSVDIFVHHENKGDETINLKLVVEDTGIGIPTEKLQEVFENFRQADGSTSRKYGGSGLGLTISRHLARLMGGDIILDSLNGMGTRVLVELPMRRGNPEDIAPTDTGTAYHGQLQDVRILVVEDNRMNLMLAQSVLESFGAKVTLAPSGQDALETLKRGAEFDIILMDIQMPGMDGIEATRHLRNDLGVKTPVIALTANTSAEIRSTLRGSGINDHLLKPYRENALVWKIHQQLRRKESPATSMNSRKDTTPTGKLYDTSRLEEFSANNAEFLRRMLQLFVEETSSGFSALAVALRNKEYPKVADFAHRMKPSFEQLNIDRLFTGIKQVEALAKAEDATGSLEELVSGLMAFHQEVIRQIRKQEF